MHLSRRLKCTIVITNCPSSFCPLLTFSFSTSSLKLLNVIKRNLTGSKIPMSSTNFVFFGLIGKTRWPSRPLIGWDTFDFFSETSERNSTKFDRKQDLNVLYQFLFFGPIEKSKMATLASVGWDIFNFSSETTEWNSMKLDRKQDSNILFQDCNFRADQ